MITIIGILIALLLPAVQAAREAARQVQCKNHLKQLSLGMLNHEQIYNRFPSGGWACNWVGDPDRGTGKDQPGSWIYNVLPYIEQEALAELGSDGDPDHWTQTQLLGLNHVLQTPLEVLICPSRRQAILYPTGYVGAQHSGGFWQPSGAYQVNQMARNDYAACSGYEYYCQDFLCTGSGLGPEVDTLAGMLDWFKQGIYPPPLTGKSRGICYVCSEVPMNWITDGVTNTYMLGEKYLDPDHYFDGVDPADNEASYVGCDNDVLRDVFFAPLQDRPGYTGRREFGSAHSNGFHMAFCDGSVHLINYMIEPGVHICLGVRDDGIQIDGKKY